MSEDQTRDSQTTEWETWLRNFDHRQAELEAAGSARRKVLIELCVERGRQDLAEWLRLADWSGP